MRSTNRRIVRNLTCLTALLVCASVPLAAQQGIDLLNAEQVLLGGSSDGTVTLRAVAAEAPTGVSQATHDRDTIRYDDGMFENFEEGNSHLDPVFTGGTVEWAQLFEVPADSAFVSGRACFLRPVNDLSRALDFKLRFYRNDPVNRVDYPGRRSGFVYTIQTDISRAGNHRCVVLRGDLVGLPLTRGKHWIGIEWDTRTDKRLAGDHYTHDDEAETDRTNMAVHETEVRWRHLPVREGELIDGWRNARTTDRTQTTSGLKAIGVSLVVERTHAVDPEPTPDPTPDPDPTPADDTCAGGACLLEDGRFRVRTRYSDGMMGHAAEATTALGGAAAVFGFGDAGPSLLVRMVDDCDGSGYWMLYAGSASDMTYSIAVRDTTSDSLMWFRGIGGDSIRGAMAFVCSN